MDDSRPHHAATIAPAILTGLGLAFARSLGEFGTTVTFAGSMPGVTRTLPLGIYLEREISAENAYALSAILIGIAVLSLIVLACPCYFRARQHKRRRFSGSWMWKNSESSQSRT